MKIGMVCPYDWAAPGGVQAHARDLTEELILAGHDVSVLAPTEDESGLQPYVVSAGRPVPVPYNGSVARVNFGVVSATRVRRWIRDGEFDVVHVHEPAAPALSMLACWVADGPLVATWHSSVERSRAMSAGYYVLQTVLEKISARIAVSERARQTLVENLGGDAILIPNGVSCRRFATGDPLAGFPRTSPGSDSASSVRPSPTLLFLGRIDEPRKGLPVLLAALPGLVTDYPDLLLLVAGPGEIEKAQGALAPELAGHVRFLGLISEADKVSAFKSAQLYVAPNTGGESFGIVLLESMAAGTPVLASDIDAFAKVLEDGRSGGLFANGDPADLARVAARLLGDTAEREQLHGEGLRRAQMYDWSTVARDVERVYSSVAVPGVRVQADLSGQFAGRWFGRGLP